MKKFRIKVDLSAFFNDERKLAHILVDPAWENVKSLQKRVEQIFEVNNVRFVTNEGCFVPPQEPIQVIKTSDVLRAFIPADDMRNKQKKAKPESFDVLAKDEEKVKKRKRDLVSKETGFTSSTPNQAKRSKSVLPLTVAIKNSTVDEITSTNEQLGIKFEKQKQSNSNLATNVEEELQTTTIVIDASCKKKNATLLPERSDEITKKRRRKKKNKNQSTKNNETTEESEKSIQGTDGALVKPTISNKLRSCFSVSQVSTLQNKSQPKLSQPGHCYFNDSGETVSTTTENDVNEKPAKVIFRCPVTEVPHEKLRVFSLKKAGQVMPETEKETPTPEIKDIQSTDNLELTRKSSKSPVIIQELLILPSLVPRLENNTNEDTLNVNETAFNQTEKSNTTTTEHSERETTNAADDSSVIAIESEYDDESEEENDKDESYEPDADVSEIIDLNASDDDSQQSTIIVSAGNQTAEVPSQKMSISEMLPFSTVLESLPVPDEIIIFKLYRLNGKRSGFIAGKCQYINKRTKIIKLLVIDGNKEISEIPKKHICSLDDSTATDKQTLQIKYNDLLDAKLFSLN